MTVIVGLFLVDAEKPNAVANAKGMAQLMSEH